MLGPTDDVPARILPIERVVSPVPVFDPSTLRLLRWVSERYVSPLAAVIARAAPPRVAAEEAAAAVGPAPAAAGVASGHGSSRLPAYRGAGVLLRALGDPRDPGPEAFTLRPAPEDEADVCVEAVAACLASGRCALVLVPEADPVPATARAVLDAFGTRAVAYLGGDRRERYRAWLAAAGGRHEVVVATRPGVFVPIPDLGLVYVSRESHPALREDRAPYYHVRDVALERARLEGAVAVLEALCPSAETAALRLAGVEPPARRWPPVEVVRPGPEGRAPRLVEALRSTRRGFVLASTPGYGVARVCRSCGEPAACAACGGLLRLAGGEVRCVVCDAPGRCAACGGTSFGVRRGGAERVEEWAGALASVPVRGVDRPRLPGAAEILVGGPDDVHDLGVGGLDLVAVLDADRASRRPGLASRERALATWFESVAWARPSGRAIVQASDPADPAVQALVRGNADRFHARDGARRAEAGFPVGAPVFRVVGGPSLAGRLGALDPITLLVSESEGRTVCLLALEPGRVGAFGRAMRELAGDGTVERVEAEPHL